MSHCNRDTFNYFLICKPWLDALNEGQVNPWVHRWRLILLVYTLPTPPVQQNCHSDNFSISYELFRLPSAKVPQDYQLLRIFVWKVYPEQWAISWYDWTHWRRWLQSKKGISSMLTRPLYIAIYLMKLTNAEEFWLLCYWFCSLWNPLGSHDSRSGVAHRAFNGYCSCRRSQKLTMQFNPSDPWI